MDLHEQPHDLLSYRLRTAQQKKRLQKKDFDQQLRRMEQRDSQLRKEIFTLPLVPLKIAYQKGWKRFFVLTLEVSKSSAASFYQELLNKINTFQHSPDKSFRNPRRRKQKKVPGVQQQELRRFHESEWRWFSQQLTEREKGLFYRQEKWIHSKKPPEVYYIFQEPWRFQLRISPFIITHIKQIDSLLESESQQLDNYITTHYLHPRIQRICYGKRFHWHDPEPDRRTRNATNIKEPLPDVIRKSREHNISTNPLWDK